MKRILRPFEMFFKHESAGGIALFITAVIAMVLANSPWAKFYEELFGMHITIGVGKWGLTEPLQLWINDGLMAIFFLVVGMEIKRELTVGELCTVRGAALPVAGALGGMLVPALIFVALNLGTANLHGWAIPTATDIAFALGVIRLFGSRVPRCAVIFLTALAIVDDIGAIIIIALFYTSSLHLLAFSLGLLIIISLLMMNRFKVSSLHVYFILGVLLWISFFEAGIHPTIAGVILGMLIPNVHRRPEECSPLHKAETILLPYVTFLIMPIFALANAGIKTDLQLIKYLFSEPLSLGIIGGLFFGKQIGIFLFSYVAVKLNLARLPVGANWKDIYGVAMIGGVGFTMSVFIADLAIVNNTGLSLAKLAIIIGSLLSGVVGAIYIYMTTKGRTKQEEQFECEC